MTDNETTEVPAEVVRLPGQEFANTGASFSASTHAGHRADPEAYTRSSKKTYRSKIAKQKARMK